MSSLIGTIRHEPSSRPSAASVATAQKLRELGMMRAREELTVFVSRTSGPAAAMLRKTRTERTNAKTDYGALEAWCGAVLLKAERASVAHRPKLDGKLATRQLAQVSTKRNWAELVKQKLADFGIVFVVLEHMPGTYLDGAAMRRSDGAPVIALTLRHDRIDNFWFTLLHEFAHVWCHLTEDRKLIWDDLDVRSTEKVEAEADEFASQALIPAEYWDAEVSLESSAEDLKRVARSAGVDAAIAFGRWQYRYGDFRRFSKLLGRGKVRRALLD